MAKCSECAFFFLIPETAGDFEAGKGDCVTEHKDQKGKFWLSKPVFNENEACNGFSASK